MLQNYFITTLRSAKKEKAFTVLNILGLTIGFTTCLYIGLYTIEELGHDTFHTKAERIYRVNQTFIWGETDKLFGSTGPGVMSAVANEVPEFEAMTRIHPLEDALVSSISKGSRRIFEEEGILSADSTFFQVFTFPLLKGNSKTALVYPFSVVITENIAEKYFGKLDIIGEELTLGERGDEKTYQITGVTADIPNNSHISFNLLTSMSSIERLKTQNDSWWWTTFVTFGVLRSDADPMLVSKKVADVPGKYLEPFLQKYKGISLEEFIASGEKWDLYIQPLLDIHLRSTHVFSRLNKVSDIKTIYTLVTLGGLILLLSVINFINLTTARATKRAKEVGVRKVLGSSRQNLIWQFMLESILFCTLAQVFSALLLGILIPYFNSLSGKEVTYGILGDSTLQLITLSITIIIGILAGIYPAFYLSAFNPGIVLKGKTTHSSGGGFVRNSLVTIQFTVSIALIACALIVNQQVQYWMNMDLGFNRDNKLIIQKVNRIGNSIEAFQNEIKTSTKVERVSFSSDTPPYIYDINIGQIKGNKEVNIDVSYFTTDEDFLDIYGLTLIVGRNFNEDFNDKRNVLVSRSLTKSFGFSDANEAINQTLVLEKNEVKIVGVFEDFITELNWEQLPIALYYKEGIDTVHPHRSLTVSFTKGTTSSDINDLLVELETIWSTFNPHIPLKYSFLDQEYEMIFDSDIRFGQLINLYSILAILIASLGLAGLVAYVIERRNKEIGIRKVLGASIHSIMRLLTSEFSKLLAIGFVIATALSWYIMNIWIEDFTYQTPISTTNFLIAGAIMALVALVTLSFQTIRAATSNPVNSLKEE